MIKENECITEEQIEIKKNEHPSDYGSDANVIFCRNGKYYIDNPNYKRRINKNIIAVCNIIIVIELVEILILLMYKIK